MKFYTLIFLTFIVKLIFSQENYCINECGECLIEYNKGVIDSANKEFYKYISCDFKSDTIFRNLCFFCEYKKGLKHGEEYMSYKDYELKKSIVSKRGGKVKVEFFPIGYKYYGNWKKGKKHGAWFTFDESGKIITKQKWRKGIKRDPN